MFLHESRERQLLIYSIFRNADKHFLTLDKKNKFRNILTWICTIIILRVENYSRKIKMAPTPCIIKNLFLINQTFRSCTGPGIKREYV